jgi:glycine/D-amino acid oxidase-like deaminating enzyme
VLRRPHGATPRTRVDTPAARALADAEPKSFWLDNPAAPDPAPALVGDSRADLVVVGAGFTGLWTALIAKERDPGRDVVVLEGRTTGWAATGRNGGFCDASITHGLGNGLEHFGDELERLEQLGLDNLDGIERTVTEHDIDCGYERTGTFDVATKPWMVPELEEYGAELQRFGQDATYLDEGAIRSEVSSPTFLGAVHLKNRTAMIDPARLAWGLREACIASGVRFHERTPVIGLEPGPTLVTDYGRIKANKVALATSAFPALVKRVRPFILPVYDYVLMTEPLTPAQREAIGWRGRQGIGDGGNQFHYYRLTDDDRILWGGYDAIYHWRNGLRDELDTRPSTHLMLAQHFLETFPQLEGIRFSHAWGGAIDTCSRFTAFWGTAQDGAVAYALGFTGLGVGSSRFGAQVMLDILSGEKTELTELKMVKSKPLPFPPEPLRSGVVNLTRWSLARADANGGRRNLWLRALDKAGLGFDS